LHYNFTILFFSFLTLAMLIHAAKVIKTTNIDILVLKPFNVIKITIIHSKTCHQLNYLQYVKDMKQSLNYLL